MSLPILSRATWGARPPKRRDTTFTKDGGIVVHYTAVNASNIASHDECVERWQAHQNYHMDTRGWNDLAYNFGVCVHGFIFEGRGWDAQNGANTPENASTLSVCLDVDGDDLFDRTVVTNINGLIEKAVNDHGWARRLRGHYEVSTTGTACPGANVKVLLDNGSIHLPKASAPVAGRVALIGDPTVTILEMQDWARSKGGTKLFQQLAATCYAKAVSLGVDPAVPYAIMGHETKFGQFGGVLDVSFRNWGGIKTAGGGGNFDPNAHQRFPTHNIGVRAVVEHVAGYAGILLPIEDLSDPRFHLLAGKRIEALPSDDWTWASSEHDSNIVRYMHEMKP